MIDTKDKPTFDSYIADLSDAQRQKRNFLIQRIDKAKNMRDQNHDEFDGMTLQEYVEKNAKDAASYIKPRQNETDVEVTTGMPREKMLDLTSNVIRLNLKPNVLAFDKNNAMHGEIGTTMGHMLTKSNDLEGDRQKQVMRIMYLMEQGTVASEEVWKAQIQKQKTFKKDFVYDPSGDMRDASDAVEKEETIKFYKCERNILDLLSVYLGDIKQFDIEKQPFIYTRQVMHYTEAKAEYGDFKNFQYVHPGLNQAVTDLSDVDSVPYRDYRMYEVEEEYVEVIKYQDRWNDEYQIMINGVMMLPINFPMPWDYIARDGSGKTYNIAWQVNEIISPFFAYGKSLMNKMSRFSDILDQMLVMFLRKTKQSLEPPTANNTGKVLSPRIYDAGTMWNDINPERLTKLIEHQGVTASETQMYQAVSQLLDGVSVSRQFQGQSEPGQQTATEVLELQRQAQISLGLLLLSVSLMEEKLAWLRLQNILTNWTKPVDKTVDEATGQIMNVYRQITIDDVDVDGKQGSMLIQFEDGKPEFKNKKEVEAFYRKRQEQSMMLLNEEARQKNPIKKLTIDRTIMRQLMFNFKIRVNPSQQDSDNLNKILFTEEFAQGMQFFGQDLNREYYKKKFAAVWGNNYDEMFTTQSTDGFLEQLNTQALANPQGVSEAIKQGSTTPAGLAGTTQTNPQMTM